MKNEKCRSTCSAPNAGHLALALACASLAGACDGYYPLGESRPERLLDDEGVPNDAVGDAQVPASLAPPDVTFGIDFIAGGTNGVVSVGDLDGDGYDEITLEQWASDGIEVITYVHLRYGGPRPRRPEEVFAYDEGGARLTTANGPLEMLLVSGAGDVDGDGYHDLLIQTGQCDQVRPDRGVYLIYGSPERLEGVRFLPNAAAARFLQGTPGGSPNSCGKVFSPHRLGDLDGDGFDDLVIDSRIDDSETPLAGSVEDTHVFYGRAERFSGDIPLTSADATLHSSRETTPYAAGDINGDGLADLLLTLPLNTFLLPGRKERWSGVVELESSATHLQGAELAWDSWTPWRSGDLDGDGLNDVLAATEDGTVNVFYGAPGLFENGFDVSQADAVLSGEGSSPFYPVGDRDGDGDDELLDRFVWTNDAGSYMRDVAFVSGGRQRLSGNVSFPESDIIAQAPNGRFPDDPGRTLANAYPAGDLDGDGAADLVTRSEYHAGSTPDPHPQLHIHYGVPAAPTPSPPPR